MGYTLSVAELRVPIDGAIGGEADARRVSGVTNGLSGAGYRVSEGVGAW